MHHHDISPEAQLFWCGIVGASVLMGLAERLCVHLARSEKMKKRISLGFFTASYLLVLSIVGFVSAWNVVALFVVAVICVLSALLRKYEAPLRRRMEEIGRTKLW